MIVCGCRARRSGPEQKPGRRSTQSRRPVAPPSAPAASIAAIRAAFRPCCCRRLADEAAACSRGRGELSRALVCGSDESVELRRLFREPRVEGGELRPGFARLLDDPVVLAGGAAEAVEPRERLVE